MPDGDPDSADTQGRISYPQGGPRRLGLAIEVQAWETVHGDLHWANLLQPDFGRLDWKLWDAARRDRRGIAVLLQPARTRYRRDRVGHLRRRARNPSGQPPHCSTSPLGYCTKSAWAITPKSPSHFGTYLPNSKRRSQPSATCMGDGYCSSAQRPIRVWGCPLARWCRYSGRRAVPVVRVR